MEEPQAWSGCGQGSRSRSPPLGEQLVPVGQACTAADQGHRWKRNKGSDNQIEEEELEKNSTMRDDDTCKARRLLYG